MRWIPDRVIRSWGLVLVATGLLAWCASLIVAGAEADDAAFERAVGWANIAGALLGSIGVVMVAVDKLLELYDVSPQRLATEMERIAREELDSEQRARAQLLGLDGPEIVAANVRFERELIQFCDAGGQTVGDLDGILSYYDGLSPRRLVILGQPGAGKTVLAVELTLRLLEQCEASGFDRSRVPLRMSLASLPADRSVEDWLIQHLKREFRLRNRIACAIVRQRRLIPVLDGLDEMDSQTGPAARAQDVVTKLNTYLAGRDLAAIVVTCRTERYEQLPIAIGSATNVYVQPLDAPTTVAYLAAVTRNAAEAAAWTPVVIAMKSEPMHPLPEVLNTPWRLTLAATYARDGGSPEDLLPASSEDTGEAYRSRVYGLLLACFPAASARRYADRRWHDIDLVLQWLVHLARHLDRQERAGRSGIDIQPREWWRAAGERRIQLIHTLLILLALAAPVTLFLATQPLEIWNLLLVLSVLGMSLITAMASSIQPKRFSLSRLRWRERVPVALFSGIGVGVFIGLEDKSAGFVMGNFTAFMVLTLAAIRRPHGDERPGDDVRRDLTAGAVGGGFFGGLLGLTVSVFIFVTGEAGRPAEIIGALAAVFATVVTAAIAAAAGAVLLLPILMVLGVSGGVALRHGLAVAVLAPRRLSPWRPVPFLAWAYHAGLLRLSGNTYQFRHLELQRWLLNRGTGLAPSYDQPQARHAAFDHR